MQFEFYVIQYLLHHTYYTSLSCQHSAKHWTRRKQISGLALHLIFHRFSPFSCCLSVVWKSLIKGLPRQFARCALSWQTAFFFLTFYVFGSYYNLMIRDRLSQPVCHRTYYTQPLVSPDRRQNSKGTRGLSPHRNIRCQTLRSDLLLSSLCFSIPRKIITVI